MPTVLVLDGDAGPALATVRSLGRAGWHVVVPSPSRAVYSRHAHVAREIPDASENPDAFSVAVARAVRSTGADIVVPSTDASVEVLWAIEGTLGGARILGADRASAALGIDKAKTLAAATDAGFPTPDWVAPGSLDEAVAAVAAVGYP
ncbi:MAG: hypothetical protein ABI990_10485, partial [Actinomycetota bacterium]